MFLSASNPKLNLCSLSSIRVKERHLCNFSSFSVLNLSFPSPLKQSYTLKHVACFATSSDSEKFDANVHRKGNSRPKRTTKQKKTNASEDVGEERTTKQKETKASEDVGKERTTKQKETKASEDVGEESSKTFPTIIIPKKPRRGRRSEAAAVEDFVRNRLEQTFASIREQSSDIMEDKGNIMKDRMDESHDTDSGSDDSDDSDEDDVNGETKKKKMVIEEDDPDWPLDADVGWGVRASEYFENHPIKNVVEEDGVEINWEGELDDCLVKEINCLEWERFAFHPSPLIVFVFERYKSASKNWKALKELEKAADVYWKAKDRLPPRTVKIDINIEKDLAYALEVKEYKDCPQILFLRGNTIVYREKDMRTADELVQMIAHFYYNAKKPACIKDLTRSPPF